MFKFHWLFLSNKNIFTLLYRTSIRLPPAEGSRGQQRCVQFLQSLTPQLNKQQSRRERGDVFYTVLRCLWVNSLWVTLVLTSSCSMSDDGERSDWRNSGFETKWFSKVRWPSETRKRRSSRAEFLICFIVTRSFTTSLICHIDVISTLFSAIVSFVKILNLSHWTAVVLWFISTFSFFIVFAPSFRQTFAVFNWQTPFTWIYLFFSFQF